MGIGTLERTSQDWAAMFGHYGEVASIDLHLAESSGKRCFFEGVEVKKTSMKFNSPACCLFVWFFVLFGCWFCFVRVNFLRIRSYGKINMKAPNSRNSKVKGV